MAGLNRSGLVGHLKPRKDGAERVRNIMRIVGPVALLASFLVARHALAVGDNRSALVALLVGVVVTGQTIYVMVVKPKEGSK